MPTTVRNPESLHYALAHHAQELEPIAGVLALGILLDLDPKGWRLRQHSTGARSFSLSRGSVEYHFRPGPETGGKYTEILVKDSWFNGKVVERLGSRLDAIRFVQKVASL